MDAATNVDMRRINEHDAEYQRLDARAARELLASLACYARGEPRHEHRCAQRGGLC